MVLKYLDSKRISITTTDDVTWDSSNTTGFSISGNTVTCTSAGWTNNYARSTQSFTVGSGEIEITGTIDEGSSHDGRIGFNTGSASGSNYNDFEWYCDASYAYVMENNVQKFERTSPATRSQGDIFKITIDNSGLVKFYANGVFQYTSLNTASGTYYIEAKANVSGSIITGTIVNAKPISVQDNSILVEKDTANRYWRTPESEGADTNTTQTTHNDDSGIGSFTGGWGARFNAGHALVGQEIRSIKVRMRCASPNTVDMTARLYGSTKATLRATSTAVSSSGLTSSYVDKTFVFPSGSRGTVQAGDHLMIVSDTAVASTGGWNCQIKSSAGTNTHFTTWQDQTNSFTEQTSRDLWYDPIVSGSIIPATWTMEPTFEDLFSSDNATDIHSANIGVANGRWEFNSKRDGTNDSSAIDLVSALSDTAWVMDFDFFLNTVTNGNLWFGFGLSDKDETSTNGTSQEAIYVSMGAGGSGQDTKISLEYVYQGSMPAGNATASRDFSTSTADSDNTTHYCRLTRTSATSATLVFYTSAARTTVSETLTMSDLNASVNGLRYIVMRNHVSTSGSGTLSGYVDNIKVYSGVTSV